MTVTTGDNIRIVYSMDASYWSKKYHEAEAERVFAQKRIEQLEEFIDGYVKCLKQKTELIEELKEDILFLEEVVRRLSGGKVKRVQEERPGTPKPTATEDFLEGCEYPWPEVFVAKPAQIQ